MNFFRKYLTTQSRDIEWFQTLQKRVDEKFKFFDSICSHMREFNRTLKTFSEKLEYQSKNFDNILYTLEDQFIYDTYKLIHKKIVDNIKAENIYAEENLKMLEIHINKFRSELSIYSDLKDINRSLDIELEELKENKSSYHKAGIDMENKTKKFVENYMKNLNNLTPQLKNQLIGFAKYPKKLLKKYKDSITKVNDLSISFNKKQEELFTLLPHFGKEDNDFFTKFSTSFLNSIQKNSELLESIKKEMSTIKQNEKKDCLNNLISDTKNNKFEKQKFELMQYQSGLEFSKCKDKNEFEIFSKTVEIINKTMEESIFPNYNHDADLKYFTEAKLVKEIFETQNIDEKVEKEFLDSLDDKMNHKAIFVVLSQLRTNTTFCRPKSLIELLGKAFNKLMNMANKIEIIDYVKNCVILSQTYFYEDENKNKVYLFEKIKSNKILNNSHFWRRFIDEMLTSEFQRFDKNHNYPKFDVEKDEKIPPKIKQKLNEIVFSQLLSFITNLIDFDMDKRVILKIADEFIQKYNYLSESNIESIYQIICKENEDIEKLRKEYDSSLESEIIEFKDENEVEKKEEVKKEEQKKEEVKKEEEKKEEDKKVEEKEEDKKEEDKNEEKKDEQNEEENLDKNEIKTTEENEKNDN